MSRFIPRNYDDWKCTDPADFNEPEPERDPDAEYDAWRDEQMNSEHGTKLLRETLRLSAARATPTAYAPGRRVMMHSVDNTRVYRGKILPGHTKPGYETPEDKRRIAWDDDMITTVPVTRLELIGDDDA